MFVRKQSFTRSSLRLVNVFFNVCIVLYFFPTDSKRNSRPKFSCVIKFSKTTLIGCMIEVKNIFN